MQLVLIHPTLLKIDFSSLNFCGDKWWGKNVSTGLSNLKSKVYELHTWKLENSPIDLSKLRDVAKKWSC